MEEREGAAAEHPPNGKRVASRPAWPADQRLAARAARGTGADRPSVGLRGRAPGGRVAGRPASPSSGAEARIEAEPAHGTYWWPLGIGAALGALGALAALRGRRLLGAAARRASARPASPTTSRPGSGACAASCPSAPPTTSSASSATPTPSARSSSSPTTTPPTPASSSTPQIPLIADRLGLIENTDTSPTLMAPVIGGPLLAALGALTGKRLLAKLGLLPRPRLDRGDGRHRRAQGRPRRQRQRHRGRRPAGAGPALRSPSRPRACGVILLSAGSEESFSEGMKAFGERHFAELAAGEHLLPLPRVDRLAAPAGAARRGLPEDARVPGAGAGADRRRWPRSWGSGSTRTCACTTAPTGSSRWRPATRPRCSPAAPTSSSRPTTTGRNDLAENVDFGTVADGDPALARRRSAASANAGSERPERGPPVPRDLPDRDEFRLRGRISPL